MNRIRRIQRATLGAALLCAVGGLVVHGESLVPLKPEQATEQLGGKQRFLAHLSTDKPVYKPGETLYLRGVVLDAFTRTSSSDGAWVEIEVLSPKGSVVASGSTQLHNGSFGYSWSIPTLIDGGDHKVRVTLPGVGTAPAEREFQVFAYRPPRFRMQIDYAREGYGPGDEVAASLEVTRAEGGFPTTAKVTAVARVDYNEVWRGPATVSPDGFATVHFTLPETIAFGEGTLTFIVEDGGVVDSSSKTIPILARSVTLNAYPEGGDLIAGVENRVYFEAIAPNGRPADVTVEVVDSNGHVLAKGSGVHEGRGFVAFQPIPGQVYTMRVVEPWSVTTEIALPAAVDGFAIRTVEGESGTDGVRVQVASTSPRPVEVHLSQRERLIQDAKLNRLGSGWADFVLDPGTASGVLRVTVLENGVPKAERLVYVKPTKEVSVALEVDPPSAVPGDTVKVTIRTTDEYGKPVASFVGVTVSDDAPRELIERRQQAPRLVEQALLEGEVRELKDPAAYLADTPEAARNLDLLLATQGWRRFATYTVDEFLKQHGDEGRRALAAIEPARRPLRRDLDDVDFIVPMPMAAAPAGANEMKGDGDDRVKEADGVVDLGFVAGGEMEGGAVAVGLGDILQIDNMPVDKEQLEGRANAFEVPEEAQANPFGDVARERVAKDEAFGARRKIAQMLLVREYAHKHAATPAAVRHDFTETVYWNAGIATGDDGEESFEFQLSDSVTSFRLMADAWTSTGALGQTDALLESKRPFFVEIKAPLETTDSDRLLVPLALVNETSADMDATLTISSDAGATLGEFPTTVKIKAHTRERILLPIAVDGAKGSAAIDVRATAGACSDSIARRFNMNPIGFPIERNFGGVLDGEAVHNIIIPTSVADGTKATARVYPSPAANLTSALQALIRDPYGCFEQTSSTNYPLVMAMQYFQSHSGVDPELIRTSREKLSAGYDRLVGFETDDKGYEWFGSTPPHEALTAYGLMEFQDMSSFHPVDPAMLKRTREWLLARRDGKGGFERSSQALDSFGAAPPDITDAYITMALALSGEKDIKPELDNALALARKSDDPYLAGLVANALLSAGRGDEAGELLRKMATHQQKDGSVTGATTSITRSGGQALLIETTSLAILAWLQEPAYAANVESAMKWLCTTCENGAFGSTQSTVLALKAIVAYDEARAKPTAPGTVELLVDGIAVQNIPFDAGHTGALEFDDFANMLGPGDHAITLRMKGGSAMPYSIAVEYAADTPASDPACTVGLDVSLASNTVAEGEAVEVQCLLTNKSDQGQPMTVAIVGMPGGLEPRVERLRELVEEGTIDFFELRGRDVALYWRDLAPNAEIDFAFTASAAVPGAYTGPASCAYLYYTDELKVWREGLAVDVTPR